MIFGYGLEQNAPNGGREACLPGLHWKTLRGAQKAADRYNLAAREDGWDADAKPVELHKADAGYVFYTR